MITVIYFDKNGKEKYDRLEYNEEINNLYDLEEDGKITDLAVYNDDEIFDTDNKYLIMGTNDKSDFYDFVTDDKEALNYIEARVKEGACLSDFIIFTKGEMCRDYRDGHSFVSDLTK